MPYIARLIGGAGTGKTSELLRIMAQVIDTGIDPRQIGFASFTRAARSEAAGRAADQFGIRRSELEQGGWFRTVHSVCYRALGVPNKCLITNDSDSREWLESVLKEPIATEEPTEDLLETFGRDSNAAVALNLWVAARNRMVPLRSIWDVAYYCDERTPDYDFCLSIARRYETFKNIDHMADFTDLLAMYAGIHIDPETGPDNVAPYGDVPELPVWFFDEQQDASPLLDAVCHRLISAETCQWVYVVGDPYQSIYTWAGADHRLFQQWPADKERIMPQSYRCPPEIMMLGEQSLLDCSDYRDRGIKPASHHGTVETVYGIRNGLERVDPRESWLILARTNHLARKIIKRLDEDGLPWLPMKGGGRWHAPSRNQAIQALHAIQTGETMTGEQWVEVLKQLPARHDGEQLLKRGTKSAAKESKGKLCDIPTIYREGLGHLGATKRLETMIVSGEWVDLIPTAREHIAAASQYGLEAVIRPQVRVGTIHSAKGAEADNVLLLTTLTQPIERSKESTEGRDEERRVEYVGITRARKNLVVTHEQTRRRMQIEC
jgi:DNA helicase-2/ATP-dependent DNA helicase PcrA